MRNAPNSRTSRIAYGKGLPIGIMLAVVGALSAGYLSLRDGLTESPWAAFERGPSTDYASTVDQLTTALAEEIRERQGLSDRIAELDAELSQLRLMIRGSEGRSAPEALEDSVAADDASAETQPELDASVEVFRFDDEALLSQGIRPDEVAQLHDRWVLHELDVAAIADRALREGWFLQGRHSAELNQLNRQLQQDLEDEDYDRYLYALGKPNRLRAVEVFEGTSASEAGLRRGDIILRYDDKRVFRRGELLVAAALGQLGESVAIEILRNGHQETIYVERGPFGAVLEPSRGEPLDN